MRATGKLALLAAVCATVAATPAVAQSIWAERPSADNLPKFVPFKTDGPREARFRIECKVAEDGRLSACRVLSEEPADDDLRAYALAMAARFRATPEAAKQMNGSVILPIRFALAEDAPPQRGMVFQRNPAYRQLGDAGPYYPERAQRMGQTAVVETDCQVRDDLRLQGCRVVSVSNPSYGFEFAFLKMAEQGWMKAAAAPEGPAPPDGVWRFRMTFDAQRR